MTELSRFIDLIRRIQSGDARAAEDLMREYEPLVRREVRMRLRDQRLRRIFDSMDICQSVMASFFLRVSSGGYDLSEPQDLVRLLVKMTKHKVASTARGQNRQKRDHRRTTGDDAVTWNLVPQDADTPSQIVAAEELLGRFRSLLDSDERLIASLRAEGLSWADIAQHMGGTAQARRMQLARAVERAIQELGLDEIDSD